MTKRPFVATCECGRIAKLIPIIGKVYIAALPIAHITPDPLIVHREVADNGETSGAWVVTHEATGFAVAKGDTRKQAMHNAQARILGLQPGSYQRAVDLARQSLAEYRARVCPMYGIFEHEQITVKQPLNNERAAP